MSCDGAGKNSKIMPKWSYKMGQEEILKTKEEKDLGVVIQDTLSPEWHISQLFGSTYQKYSQEDRSAIKGLTKIRVAFHYIMY